MKHKRLLIALALCFAAAAIGCFAWFFWTHRQPELPPVSTTAATTAVTSTTKAAAPYKSPIDFKSLQKKNEDIYAWLEIPNTTISELVVQSDTDDNEYLRHTIEGKYSIAGTLFTEHVYNSKTFNDRVTVIYGHHMLDDTMFGNLQAYYSEADAFEKYGDIIIYLPDRELHYAPIAAVPYSNQHILYHYKNFLNFSDLEAFIKEVYEVRAFSVNRKEDYTPNADDRLLILSTCLQGNRNKRYLVIAQLETVVDQIQ